MSLGPKTMLKDTKTKSVDKPPGRAEIPSFISYGLDNDRVQGQENHQDIIVRCRQHVIKLFNANEDKYQVVGEALLRMEEDYAIEGLLPCWPVNCHNQTFLSATNGQFASSYVYDHEQSIDMTRLLAYYAHNNSAKLKRIGVNVDNLTESLNSGVGTVDLIKATAIMLQRDIVIYKTGEKGRHPRMSYFQVAARPIEPENTFFFYEEEGTEREQVFWPLRLVDKKLYSVFGGVRAVFYQCFESSGEVSDTEPDNIPEDEPEVDSQATVENKSASALFEAITEKYADKTRCLGIIMLIIVRFEQKLREANVPSKLFFLNSNDVQEILSLLPDDILMLTIDNNFKRLIKSLSKASSFRSSSFTKAKAKTSLVDKDHFSVIRCTPNGSCMFSCMSVYCFGSEEFHLLIRILCIVVILKNYETYRLQGMEDHTMLETENANEILQKLCNTEASDTAEYPGAASILAFSYLLKEHVCILSAFHDKEDQVNRLPNWYAYDREFIVPTHPFVALFSYTHYDFLALKTEIPYPCITSITIEGPVDRNTGQVNKQYLGIADAPQDNIQPPPPNTGTTPEIIQGKILRFDMNANDSLVQQINETMTESQLQVSTSVVVKSLKSVAKQGNIPSFIESMYKSKEFHHRIIDAVACIPGVAIIKKGSVSKKTKSPSKHSQERQSTYKIVESLEGYSVIERQIGRIPKEGKLTDSWYDFQHKKFGVKSILSDLESVPLTTSDTGTTKHYYGISGGPQPLRRSTTPGSDVIVNVGTAALIVLQITFENLPALMTALRNKGAFKKGKNWLPDNECDLFCGDGKIFVARDFLIDNNVNHDCIVLEQNQCFVSGVGSLIQLTPLGKCHFQKQGAAFASFVLLADDELLASFVHDCKVNKNLRSEIKETLAYLFKQLDLN